MAMPLNPFVLTQFVFIHIIHIHLFAKKTNTINSVHEEQMWQVRQG